MSANTAFKFSNFTFKTLENISIESEITSEDFWSDIYYWNWMSILTSIWSLISILSIPLGLNIIIFNDNKHNK